ncbi:porin [Pseudoduganella danionis]|uniref:porin n=1 Tax=Pseudoduganella danionis TaxID=1890295 RepID=UPI0035AF2532
MHSLNQPSTSDYHDAPPAKQHRLPTLLTAAVAMLASHGAAHAQSNVQIYGLIDSAIVLESGGPKGRITKLESGVSNGSRLGFKGEEDLGGGTSAFFLLESGMLVDTGGMDQGGLLFGRQGYVGLRQKDIGALYMGRVYVPIYQTLTTIDPMANQYAGAAGQLMSGAKAGARQNNTVMFISEEMQGWTTQLAYGAGEVAGNAAASRQLGGSLTYSRGDFTARIGYNQTNNATATDSAHNTLMIAKYNFGPVIAGLGYAINHGIGSIDSRDSIAALTIPLGKHTLMATYIDKNDRATSHKYQAHQYAGAYSYALSKRTALYASFAYLSNTNFTTTRFGTGNREYDLGMRFSF